MPNTRPAVESFIPKCRLWSIGMPEGQYPVTITKTFAWPAETYAVLRLSVVSDNGIEMDFALWTQSREATGYAIRGLAVLEQLETIVGYPFASLEDAADTLLGLRFLATMAFGSNGNDKLLGIIAAAPIPEAPNARIR